MKMKIWVSLLCAAMLRPFLFEPVKAVRAQEMQKGYVIDEFDPRAIAANPALLTFQFPTLISAYRVFHVGITDQFSQFKQIHIGFSLPFFTNNLGWAVYYNGFQSPIFQRNNLSGVLSYRLFRRIGLGVGVSMRQFGYNLDNGILVDPDDPVFRNGTSRITFSVDAGLTVALSQQILLAGGIRNLNEPPLSLNSYNFKDQKVLFGGIAYRMGLFRVMLEAASQGNQIQTKFAVEMSGSDGRYLRVGYSPDQLVPNLDIQIPLLGGFKLNYSYSLPISPAGNDALQGSHNFAIIFDLRRLKSVPAMPAYSVPDVSFELDERMEMPDGHMLVVASQQLIHLNEREIIRDFDRTVSPSILAHLSPADLGVIDVRMNLEPTQFEVDTLTLPEQRIEPMGTAISPEYQKTFEILSKKVRTDSSFKMYLVAVPQYLYRAAQIRAKYLNGRKQVPENVRIARPIFASPEDSVRFFSRLGNQAIRLVEHYVEAEPETIWFDVYDGRFRNRNSEWMVIITNSKGEIIRQLQNKGLVTQISWDLRDQQNQLVGPGVYTYHIEWRDSNGNIRRSPAQKLYCKKRKRTLHIAVTRNPDQIENISVDEIKVFFRK